MPFADLKTTQNENATFAIWTTNIKQTLVTDENAINIFPNPATSYFNITSEEKIEQVVVKDVIGREIYHSSADNNKTITVNTKDWARGLYYVIISYAQQAAVTEKIFLV